MSEALAIRDGYQLEPTRLTLERQFSFDEWEALGQVLGHMGRNIQWWIGDWVNYGEAAYGEKYAQAMDVTGVDYAVLANYAWVASRVSLRNETLTWTHHLEVAALEPSEQERWLEAAAKENLSTRELRARIRNRPALNPPAYPEGQYATVVIDPPWPVEKILRDVRPQQGPALDYPVMQLDEIEALPVPALAGDGCHVYLWVTHRFLPAGLELFDAWGVSYECLMTWVKNVGMTPFSWMYDTEHVLFGRVGQLEVVQKGQRLSFSESVQGHSVKPDVFYERVLAASPEPRLEMFARRTRAGFEPWGNEVAA